MLVCRKLTKLFRTKNEQRENKDNMDWPEKIF